jgi:hypothetical protein
VWSACVSWVMIEGHRHGRPSKELRGDCQSSFGWGASMHTATSMQARRLMGGHPIWRIAREGTRELCDRGVPELLRVIYPTWLTGASTPSIYWTKPRS